MFLTTKSGYKIYLPSDEEDVDINRHAGEDETAHSDEELAQFMPFADSKLPEAFKASVLRGRRKAPRTKVPIAIRLDKEVLDTFKATGKGWQTRINEALKDWLKEHVA